MQMKKRSEATQTLCTGCSKADPHTNKHTDKGSYNTLCSLAHSVKKNYKNYCNVYRDTVD